MISKLFSIFSKRKKKEEELEKILEEENKIVRETRYPTYPTIGDLQMQSDMQYILQVINSKIDTLLAKVDNLSLRLSNLEQIIYNFLYRR